MTERRRMSIAAGESTVGARRARATLLVPLALGALYAGQCLWFVATQSFTYDEPAHVIAGLDAWRHARFEQWKDQPPLARLMITAPLMVSRTQWRLEDLGPSWANYWTIAIRPDPVSLAWRTRPVNIALGLALAALLWTTARRMFSVGGANLALALFVCSPALIAHFSLTTVDGPMTLFLFAMAVAVARWRVNPSWPATLGLGALAGGLLVT
jgi:hypothetical protein